MIHRIYSNLPSFKNLEFHSGLNVLLSEKSRESTSLQTRNRAGKTSLIETIHYLTCANVDKNTPFSSKELEGHLFGMEFDLLEESVKIEREHKPKSNMTFNGSQIKMTDLRDMLGKAMFRLQDKEESSHGPTFRLLFPYFVRRAINSAFISPEKQAIMQITGDYQMALMYFLGLDWQIARDWQSVREREKSLGELKKVGKSGGFGNIIGSTAELRTQLALEEDRQRKLEEEVQQFRVHPQYTEMETEADQLTRRLNEFANNNTIDLGVINNLEKAISSESPPETVDIESMYKEMGILLPDMVKKRYEDVRKFHDSVIRNRRAYLADELNAARRRIELRNNEKVILDKRRSDIMSILKSHGALEQFMKLQAEVGMIKSKVEILRQRFENAELIEGTKSELEIERNRLLQRLRRDFTDQNVRLSEAILAYEETSKRLYEDAGSMVIDENPNGPTFRFEIHGSRSEGIKNMQIFCFDMMIMRLCAQRGIGPGFLVHDSHLFDGVDGRQVISAMRVGAEAAEKIGFQYIVTMNEDDAFKESIEGFDLRDYVLKVKLTDATEDGGLFGIRFD